MSETPRKTQQEIALPDTMDDRWLQDFTEHYGGKGVQATLRVEDWLEQPDTLDI